jgi:hypothetical protein
MELVSNFQTEVIIDFLGLCNYVFSGSVAINVIAYGFMQLDRRGDRG